MAKNKKIGKREKLDLILSELQKLKGEVKALGKQQADLAAVVGKLTPKTAAAHRPAAKPAKVPAKKPAETARKAGSAPKRPVLVSPPDAAAG